jgi:hypothetical protein
MPVSGSDPPPNREPQGRPGRGEQDMKSVGNLRSPTQDGETGPALPPGAAPGWQSGGQPEGWKFESCLGSQVGMCELAGSR